MTRDKRLAHYRLILAITLPVLALANLDAFASEPADAIEIARQDQEHSSLRIQPARLDGMPGLVFLFFGTDDLHYYAKSETAPAADLKLTIVVVSDVLRFAPPIFPKWRIFRDPTGAGVEVYAGDFTVFVPIASASEGAATALVDITIKGITCTSQVCLPPFDVETRVNIDYAAADTWPAVNIESPAPEGAPGEGKPSMVSAGPDYSLAFALLLALIAGLTLNVMPCVWPVLPLIVMRIVQQAKDTRGRSFTLGLAFCAGILLFFAALAGLNIILQVFYGTVMGWGDPFRSPTVITGLVILLVFLAMAMFGLVNVALPSAIAGAGGAGAGYFGSVGMGFLAAVLSTPCGFGILAAAFGWAQTQHWSIATVVILTIGIGMAVPYAILISVPGLLSRLPRPGRWMELVKQAIGFTLLFIAAKFLLGLSDHRRDGVLYFCVLMAVALWMWGSWVDFNTPRSRKFAVRLPAVILVGVCAWAFLPARAEMIDWQPWDAARIDNARTWRQPVLIDFTADWCLNCVVVDKRVYSDPAVADLIQAKNVLPIRADTTENDYPATIALKEVYQEPGTLPVNMLFAPGADEPVRWRGTNFKDELIKALDAL